MLGLKGGGNEPPDPGSLTRQVKNSVIYLVPVALGSLVPLATLPIFTRILSPVDYGAFSLATVYAVFATGIGNLGLTIGYERNFFQHTALKERAALLYSVLLFVSVSFVAIGVPTWVFRGTLARWIIGSGAHGNLLFCAFCANAVTSLKLYCLLYFRNMEDAKAYAWFNIDETLLATAFSLAFVAFFRMGPMGLALGQLTAGLIILAVVARRIGRTLPPAWDSSLLHDSLRVSLPLTPRIFLGVVGNQFDKYMLGLLATVGGVGVYSVGQRLSYVAFQYMTAIENVFTPEVYKRMFALGDSGGAAIGRYLTPFAYASVAVALLIAMLGEEILVFLTPSAYHGAIPVVALLAVFYGILFFGKMPQLIFKRKTGVTSLLAILSIGLSVGFNFALIPRWGAVGAASASVVAGLLSGAVAFAVRQRYYRIEWEYPRIAAIFGLFVGGALLLPVLWALGTAYWIRLLVKLAFIGAFVWLGVRLGYLRRGNVDLIRRTLVGLLRGGSR